MHRRLQWDIFCQVIDNHGDVGVCWRLSADLASRGQAVRLWIDDASALAWMAPDGAPGVEIRAWEQAQRLPQSPEPATDVLVEAFGCTVPEAFLAAVVAGADTRQPPQWINLEYLSAELYVERSHALPSPVFTGPAAGWTKRFFYPGFTSRTGGLLCEPDLARRQASFDPAAWLRQRGIADPQAFLAALFCYEPQALPDLLVHWAAHGQDGRDVNLLVAAGRGAACAQAWAQGRQTQGRLRLHFLPYLSQVDFDHLLWACDLNFVRGEDSLVRAIWAGKPFVWQIYPQDDGAHWPKLQAFMGKASLPPAVQALYRAWNWSAQDGGTKPGLATPSGAAWTDWQAQAGQFRQALWAQADLGTQLLGFALKTG